MKENLNGQQKSGGETRQRILDSAKQCFAATSYDAVGVRDIAKDAGVDAALVMRYFGSKEQLFRQIAAEAFSFEQFLSDGPDALVERILDVLFATANEEQWREEYDPFRLLLSSIGSNIAGPIISEAFREAFVRKLEASLRGRSKHARAVLASAYILGVSLVRITEPQETFTGAHGHAIRENLRTSLAECILA